MPIEWWKSPVLAPVIEGGSQGGTQTPPSPGPVAPIGQPIPQAGGPAPQGPAGYTGKGPDQVAQPSRRVPGVGDLRTDKHEAEFIFDADATAAIGPDVLEGVRQAAKAGKLDVNRVREAAGQQPKPGFQAGGYEDDIGFGGARGGGAGSMFAAYGYGGPGTATGRVGSTDVGTTPFGGTRDRVGTGVGADTGAGTDTGTQTASEQYGAIAIGEYGPFEAQRARLAEDIGGAGAAATAAQKQEAAQAGMTPEQISQLESIRQRDVESQTAQQMQALTAGQEEMQFQAIGLGAQAAKEEFLNAAEFGDDATVRDAYEKYFGREMDPNASVADIRAYARALRGQEVTKGELTIEGMELELGDEKFNQVVDRINAGATWGADGSMFDIDGDGTPDITEDQFWSIQTERELNIRGLRADIGHAEFDLAMDKILNDVPWSAEEFPGITEEEYNSMRTGREFQIRKLEAEIGTTEFNRAMNMVNNGVPYGDGSVFDFNGDGTPDITEDQYRGMETIYELGIRAAQQNITKGDLEIEELELIVDEMKEVEYWDDFYAGIDDKLKFNPQFVSSGAWRTDVQTKADLAMVWTASNMPGRFDPQWDANGKPINDAAWWAENQVAAASINQLDAATNEWRNSSWYRGLSDEDKAKYENEVFPALQAIARWNGVTVDWDEDETLMLRGPDGKIFWPPAKSEVTTGDNDLNSVSEILDVAGIPNEPEQVQFYLDYMGGELPSGWDAADYITWRAGVGDIVNVTEYINGEYDGELTGRDKRLFDDIRAAQKKDANKRTPQEEVLAGLLPPEEDVPADAGGGDGVKYSDYYVGKSTNRITDPEGNKVGPDNLVKLFAGANVPGQPGSELYEEILDTNAVPLNITIKDQKKNTIENIPSAGSIVNVGGRLMIVKETDIITKLWAPGVADYDTTVYPGATTQSTSRSGREADSFVLLDLATGTEQRFAGTKDDISRAKSYNGISDWAAGLA